MTPAAKELLEFMTCIATAAYPSGRQQHLEFALWYTVVNGPMSYGQYEITEPDIARLRELSYACDGWIVCRDGASPEWVPLREWQDIFSRHIDLVNLG